ncbi:MAG: hypothetical protein ABUT20_52590 [Bacteroidota bacterium]
MNTEEIFILDTTTAKYKPVTIKFKDGKTLTNVKISHVNRKENYLRVFNEKGLKEMKELFAIENGSTSDSGAIEKIYRNPKNYTQHSFDNIETIKEYVK